MKRGVEDAAQHAAREREAGTSRGDRRARGIVPTPPEVARHGIARLDQLLRRELGIAEGLASERVVVIDPAVGTGVWLAALLAHTAAQGGTRAQLIGIDVDEDALSVARALLAPEADRQAATLALRVDNTLALASPFPEGPHVRVIVGNPPWAARSLSRGTPLSDAWLAEFRRDHEGRALDERRLGVLSDDYVRFFRWALEQARTAQEGAALCLATNASFLDGPVHRGMRAALAHAFDRIELRDLGGNALLSRTGASDENLFGVRVGAALTWAVRRPGEGARRAVVGFSRLVGTRAEKLASLAAPDAPAQLAVPVAPWFSFRPTASASLAAERSFSLAEALPFHREGVQTNRDALVTAASADVLRARLASIASGALPLVASGHLDPAAARRLLSEALASPASCIEPLAYRPLDTRVFVALAPLCHRPRHELLAAVRASSWCLLAVRKERGAAPFNLFAPAVHAADACFLSTRSSCRTRVFPSHAPDGAPNLAPHVAERLARAVGREVASEEVIAYALAVLGAPRFRAAHDEALKRDYPQLPLPPDAEALADAREVACAFRAALHEAVGAPASLRLVAADPVQQLAPHALRHDPVRDEVWLGERRLLEGVPTSWWTAQVGHHRLALAALSRPRPRAGDLVEGLARAAAWAAAEACADALVARLDLRASART